LKYKASAIKRLGMTIAIKINIAFIIPEEVYIWVVVVEVIKIIIVPEVKQIMSQRIIKRKVDLLLMCLCF
jgi:hypothetical protein